MSDNVQLPRGVDPTIPSTARMYDYLIGGKDHLAVDRETADRLIEQLPDISSLAKANRAFMQRAVRHLTAECGVRQFIDVGTGIPAAGNVHEIAHPIAPDARIVYVDHDAVTLAHAEALLSHHDANAISIDADMRHPEQILRHRRVRELIDFTEPVAVLFVAILHFATDADDPARIVATMRDALPSGSYVVISHLAHNENNREQVEHAQAVYDRASSPLVARDHEQITALFDGFELISPGVVDVSRWRPETDVETTALEGFAGVGRLP